MYILPSASRHLFIRIEIALSKESQKYSLANLLYTHSLINLLQNYKKKFLFTIDCHLIFMMDESLSKVPQSDVKITDSGNDSGVFRVA